MSQSKPTQSQIDAYAGNYALYGDQSRAWRVAFPKSKAANESINVKASQFHSLVSVRLRVTQLKLEAKEIAENEFGLSAEYVARRLKEIDELDILDIMNDDLKSFKALSDWPKVWRTSISGLDLMTLSKDDEDIDAIIKKIKWPDKTKNLELIGKLANVNAFKHVVEHNAGEGVTFNMSFSG